MRKFYCFILLLCCLTTAKAQCEDVYTLVKPNCAFVSFGLGSLINTKVGDYDFRHNYVTYDFSVGKYFDKNFGISANVSFSGSTNGEARTRLLNVGAELNSRVTNYYADSPIDLGFNIGISYGRFDFDEDWVDSEGVNYYVPKVSVDIIFNITNDKAFQFIVEPSYRYFIPTETKYYYDDCSEVNADIGLVGITGKLKVNF